MAFNKTVLGWFGYSPSSTPSAAQLESRNGVLLLPQDSVVIDEINRQEKKLGRGTFAKVYIGMHMGKERAIKVFNGKSDSIVDKAWEEYEKLNSLKHPNIVRVYGMWEDPHKRRNAPAIVMELCDHSLQEYIQQYHPRGSITREHKLKILHDITCAMVYLHSQNIIHGDLRTPNVLIKRNEDELTAKLTDFGMTRMLDPQLNSHVTSNVGDDEYMPPEVFDHKEQKDRKKNWAKLTTQVDVFMFGPVTIELACGEFPKPTLKHEIRKGKVTRTFSEIERREQYLTKVKASDRAITDVIVKMCLAEYPEDRGIFLDLQRIVKGFQRQKDQPGSAGHFQDLYEEAQEELEGMRSLLEADQKSLYQQYLEEILKDEKKQLQDAYDDLKDDNNTLKVQLKEKVEEIAASQQKFEVTVTQLNEVTEKQDRTQGELETQKDIWQTLQQEYSKDHIKQLEDTVRLGNEERTRFAQQLSAEKATCSQTEAELEKLKHEFQKKDEEIILLKHKCEDTEAKLTVQLLQVHEQRDQALRKLEDLEQASENKRKDFQVKVQAFADLRKQFDKLKHDRSTLELKLQQTCSAYEKEQKNCERERVTTKGLRTEIAQLKDILSSLDADFKECSVTKAELGEQLSEVQDKLKTLESAKKELQDGYDKVLQQHKGLQRQFETVKIQSGHTEKDLKVQLERLKMAECSLHKQLNNSNWVTSKLENEKKVLEEKVAGLEKGLACLKAAEGKLTALQIEHEKTTATLKSKEQELKNAKGALEKASSDAKVKEHINRSLEVEINKVKDSLLRKDKELKSITYVLKLKERQLIEAMKRHSPAQTTKMDLGDRLESLELKLHLKEKEVTELRATIEQNEEQKMAVMKEKKLLEKQLKEAKANPSVLRKLDKDIRDLQQKLLKLEGVERQRNDLSDKLGSLRVEKESLEHKRGFLEADCTRLELEKRAVIEERDQLKKENDAQLREAKDFLLQASHTEESLKASLKNVEDDLQQKERDFNHAKDSEQKLSEKIAELNESLGVKEAEIERLNAAIEEDRTAVEEAKDTVKIVHKYSRELNAKLKEAKEQSIKAEVLKLRNEELEKALKEARDDKRREEQTEATELDAREMTEKNEQVNRLEKVVAELQEYKIAVIKEKKLLEGELHAAVSARNARVRELSLLTEELKKVTKKAQMDHKEWEEKAAKLLKQEDFSSKAIDNTKSSLQQSLHKATALEKEKQNLMTNLQAAQQRCERLNIDYDRERKVASGLKADNARLTGELQKDKSASNKFRDEARKKRGALQQCIAVLQGHVKACKSDLDKAKKANAAQMAQYEDGIHSMKVQLKKKLTAVESESEVAIRRSRELTEENKQVWMESKDVHHANVMLRQKLLKLNEQALKAQGEVQRLEELLQSRNKELDSVKDEIDNVTAQHQETLLTVEQLQDSLCTKKEDLQAATENVSSLRTSLQERTDKCECLQSSLAEMSQQWQSLGARMQDLNGNVTTLEVERNMLSAGNDEIRRANKDLVDKLESRAVTIDDLMKDNASCHEKVQIAEGALSTCRDELAVKAEESRAQGITVDRLNEELHSKQERLASLSSTILEKDDEIQTLQLHLQAANFVSAVVTSSLECSWGADARRLQSAQKRCEELSVELSYKQQEFDTACEELEIQKEKYAKAKDLTHELEDAQMQLQSESHHLQAAVENLEKSRASMQGSHDELNDSFVSLEEENKSLSLSLEQLQIKYNAFKGEVASLSLQCGKAVAERHMIKAECDTVHRHMADIAAKNEELEQENKHLTKIKRTANQLKTKESELKSKEKNMMQLSQEADKREAMLKGREEAFDSKWQHLDVTRQLGRQQSLLQRKHEKFAKSFAATTTASLAGNRKVVEQMKREQLIVGKELQRDFVALKASLATELQEILCQSQGSLESRFESSAEKQLQTQQQVVEQVQGLLLKEIEKADTKSLTALSEHKAILHQIQEKHQGMLDERTGLIKDLDCKRSQYERILRADQDKCGKKHLEFEVASLGDLMVPFVLTLPFSHAVTHPSNTGTCVPMKELSKVCALSGFEIASIGSLSPKCSGLLPPFHACCTRAVRHLVEKISQTFTTETFQVYSVGFLKSSDKVYMCRLLMAVVPRMLDFSEDKDLEPKILYTLARIPLLGKGKEEGNRDSYREVLFEPKWYTGEPRTWAHTFLFQNFPSSLHHVSEQLELDMSRKLAESLREALSR